MKAASLNSDKSPYQVLIVDDEAEQRVLERDILDSDIFNVVETVNGSEAIKIIKEQEFDVVLLDRHMPGMSGDEVCRHIREIDGDHFLPIIMITGDAPDFVMHKNLRGYANDYIRKPYSPVELIARVKSAAMLKRKTDQLESIESILYSLARMVEAKDGETGDHCSRLVHICTVFGEALGLDKQDITALRRGGVLHDIGKIGIPDRILLKKGSLDENEMHVMRQHVLIGYELCQSLKSLRSTLPIIKHHHERFNGSGYPCGLAGNDIPLLARIFQIADIYDALTNERVYKKAFSLEKTIAIFEEETKKGWRDPELVSVFFEILQKRPDDLILLDNDEQIMTEEKTLKKILDAELLVANQ